MKRPMSDDLKSLVKWLCRRAAVRHALMRERYIGPEERVTDALAQYHTATFLIQIRGEWRREKREAGL